ncbi:hypothetical protein CHLNCDRAFT_142767 [Chlorella variabilis]|uniref:Uncharacterized protein n=1 Tax=Chlorella variabilis TaxID=554065 RepID=E1Z8P8_CHLVA|nr:hypothetical protein CHLNCDRAFT_142767 [Chlorella variabilis]EFN57645.1 hypothetical protein CHLNCDRAFT_142767 [Chlorella variabilis]|eukprot:XP_005849747.1 hypothetical protein CHLNCDRAFT_142767 [Chlorella variabilis]
MVLDWASSGSGECTITLQDAQQLAVDAGFTPSRWQVQQHEEEIYVGEVLDGKRQGMGILLGKGGHSWLLYVGQFSKGRRSGLGVAASSRGERLAGHWHEDVPWGPGVYTYAQPASPGGSHGETGGAASSSGAAAGARWRLRFEGILNGRPQGKGCMTWSDGSQEMGRFDGNNCSQALDEADDISRVLAVAAENARSARAAAEAAQEAALQQELHVMRQAQQLLDRIALFPKEQM